MTDDPFYADRHRAAAYAKAEHGALEAEVRRLRIWIERTLLASTVESLTKTGYENALRQVREHCRDALDGK